jgi:putative ABC transport system permease protein
VRPLLLLRETFATAWAAKVPTALVAFLVAVMCAATLATVGRTAAAEALLLERLESAGSRLMSVSDVSRGDALLPTALVDQIAGLSTSERAFGALLAVDVVGGPVGGGGQRVPAWGIVGDLTAAAELVQGRLPGPGEALISEPAMERLGFDAPSGWVALASTETLLDLNIVGSFRVREPFTDYASGILYLPPHDTPVSTVHVVLADPASARVTQGAVAALIRPPRADMLRIESPLGLAELQQQVMGDMNVFGRSLLLGVLGGGALLVAVVTLADVLVRRADLGRRRALGATRATIISLVVGRTLIASLFGAAVGLTAGIILSSRLSAVPPTTFTVGTGTLAILAAITSAVPPAIYAATRDPVRVLRTP